MKCPKCGEDLPLLSKVCPVCRTLVNEDNGTPDAVALSQAIDQEVIRLQKFVPEATALRLGDSAPLFLLVLAVGLVLLGIKTGSALLWILAITSFVGVFLVFRKQKRMGLGTRISDTRISYDYGKTLVKRFYSGKSEMTAFLRDADEKVLSANERIETGRRKNRLAGIVVAGVEVLLLLLLYAIAPARSFSGGETAPPEDFDKKIEYYLSAGQPEKVIQAYSQSEFNNEFVGGEQRKVVCRSLCEAGYLTEAEEFCARYCLGNAEDLDCAKIVALACLRQEGKKAAIAFVDTCVPGLRYSSDAGKLRAVLK